MRIQHNIMAMNAYRNLGTNNTSLGKNLEKLSSGYRINRAGDDAAGLAISEKMRAQISGLDQAQKNAQSGINLVKTAEGALTEVHDMLNRMVTLATQSANGTYEGTDRAKLQAEVDALVEEIDRIADNSNFNGTKLLNGELGGAAKVTTAEGTDETTPAKAAVYEVDLTGIKFGNAETLKAFGVTVTEGTTTGLAAANDAATNAAAIVNALNADATFKATHKAELSGTKIVVTALTAGVDAKASAMKTALDGTVTTDTTDQFTATTVTEKVPGAAGSDDATGATTKLDLTGRVGEDVIGSTITIDGSTYEFVTKAEDVTGTNKAVVVAKADNDSTLAGKLATEIAKNVGTNLGGATNTGAVVNVVTTATGADAEALKATQVGKGLTLQIGADAVETIGVSVDSMKADALKIDNLDIGSVSNANAAIKTINDAIEQVSVTRGNLGAIQNRLEHTINNLGVMEENIQDAEANIRDTDIADEMMAYTKNNILIQSAQAMLAQANQVPQGVLQLMQ